LTNAHIGVHPLIPRMIRLFAVPIVVGWLALTVILNVFVPQVEVVGQLHSVSLSPTDAPSMQAMQRIGKDFGEFDSDSAVMIVLEGNQPLGADAHHFYDRLIDKLAADKKHVQHIQNFWGDPLTAAGSQSADGKAAYVQLYLAGNQGESLANESVEAVRNIVANTPPLPGIKTYVAGTAALMVDQHEASDKSLRLVTAVTIGVIFIMLLLVYRSVVTVLLVLATVFIELAAARGIVAFLGYHDVIGLSPIAVSLLTLMTIAAGADYAIFLLGRYHEAIQSGESRENAFYTMYHGTAHVILGSGLTVAGATYCLSFTRLPFFQTLGIPVATGLLVGMVAALTMAPALITVASRFGLLDPKRKMQTRGWRRVGTAVVRWPGPILAASLALALVGLLALPAYQPSYEDRNYLPASTPANQGFQAADRHFPQARMNPELLLVETDRDVRNSADMLVIDRITKGIFRIPGIGRVQSITRPLGTPIEHTSIPFLISMQGTIQTMNQDYMDARMADMLTQSDAMQNTINTMEKMQSLTAQMAATTHSLVTKTKNMTVDIEELRDHIADFDDFLRPLRSYFYWEPHCFDIPTCWSIRSVFDTLDGIDTTTDNVKALVPDLEHLDSLMPQLVAVMPNMIETMKTMKTTMLTMYQTQKSVQDQTKAIQNNATAMGQAFDASKNDDSFYLPPEVFDNPDFKRVVKMFISPDGKAIRFIVSHEGDPATAEGISHIDPIKNAAFEAIKGTPLEGSKIYLGGTAATFKDMRNGGNDDLLIAGVASLALIFVIMLGLTRSVVAALVIVGTVLLSLGASFGLSVLIWQHILGIPLEWMVLVWAVVILLAVGSDYNLLLVSRFKEEIHAGLRTGIIRSIAGTGAVVTSAGLVFAFTMATMLVSDIRSFGQLGTTVGLGLVFDTLVVRSFMTPSIAALLGRWFWWPQRIHRRPTRVPSRPAIDTEPIPVGGGGKTT
jgi:putative drug exporter of the RND superfamily